MQERPICFYYYKGLHQLPKSIRYGYPISIRYAQALFRYSEFYQCWTSRGLAQQFLANLSIKEHHLYSGHNIPQYQIAYDPEVRIQDQRSRFLRTPIQ